MPLTSDPEFLAILEGLLSIFRPPAVVPAAHPEVQEMRRRYIRAVALSWFIDPWQKPEDLIELMQCEAARRYGHHAVIVQTEPRPGGWALDVVDRGRTVARLAEQCPIPGCFHGSAS